MVIYYGHYNLSLNYLLWSLYIATNCNVAIVLYIVQHVVIYYHKPNFWNPMNFLLLERFITRLEVDRYFWLASPIKNDQDY